LFSHGIRSADAAGFDCGNSWCSQIQCEVGGCGYHGGVCASLSHPLLLCPSLQDAEKTQIGSRKAAPREWSGVWGRELEEEPFLQRRSSLASSSGGCGASWRASSLAGRKP